MNKYAEIERAFRLWKNGKASPDAVPEGWFTTLEFATHNQIHTSTSSRRLNEMCKKGLVEMRKFRVAKNEIIVPVPHYRTCKNSKKTP